MKLREVIGEDDSKGDKGKKKKKSKGRVRGMQTGVEKKMTALERGMSRQWGKEERSTKQQIIE